MCIWTIAYPSVQLCSQIIFIKKKILLGKKKKMKKKEKMCQCNEGGRHCYNIKLQLPKPSPSKSCRALKRGHVPIAAQWKGRRFYHFQSISKGSKSNNSFCLPLIKVGIQPLEKIGTMHLAYQKANSESYATYVLLYLPPCQFNANAGKRNYTRASNQWRFNSQTETSLYNKTIPVKDPCHLAHPCYNLSSHLPYAFNTSDQTAQQELVWSSYMLYALLGEPLNFHVLFHKHRRYRRKKHNSLLWWRNAKTSHISTEAIV